MPLRYLMCLCYCTGEYMRIYIPFKGHAFILHWIVYLIRILKTPSKSKKRLSRTQLMHMQQWARL